MNDCICTKHFPKEFVEKLGQNDFRVYGTFDVVPQATVLRRPLEPIAILEVLR